MQSRGNNMENKMDNIELAMSILNRNILDKDLDAEAIKKAKQVIHFRLIEIKKHLDTVSGNLADLNQVEGLVWEIETAESLLGMWTLDAGNDIETIKLAKEIISRGLDLMQKEEYVEEKDLSACSNTFCN